MARTEQVERVTSALMPVTTLAAVIMAGRSPHAIANWSLAYRQVRIRQCSARISSCSSIAHLQELALRGLDVRAEGGVVAHLPAIEDMRNCASWAELAQSSVQVV